MQTEIEKLLKSKDLSLTSVRLAVLEVLHHHPHSDARSEERRVGKECTPINENPFRGHP